VLDTEAVAAARDAARHAVAGNAAYDMAAAVRAEFAGAKTCRQVLAVNAAEAALLGQAGLGRVGVLGTIARPAPTQASFNARAGLLFVAAIHEQESPNFDALCWYAAAVLPVLKELFGGQPPMLNVVGYAAPGVDLSMFAGHPHIKLHGPVGDLRPFYSASRVFIAPTRFAAGTPYKLYEAASFGLPAVATDLLARQLGWRHGRDLLAAPPTDPAEFAASIETLYRSAPLWTDIREAALARITAENGQEDFDRTVASVLRQALYKADGQRLRAV
jgi:hypothetical protein